MKMKKKLIIRLIIFTLLVSFESSFANTVYEDTNKIKSPAEVPVVSAKNAILIEQDTGKVLYEKNSRVKAYPASVTKVLTALLAVESGRLDEQMSVPGSAVGAEGSSIYLEAGEKMTLRDLTYGLMLRSGNDAALAISCLLESSTEDFVDKMNERAMAIGAMDTHFVNPNGLFDENHFTTAYDMALIAKEAMKNPDFREIARAKSWQVDRGEGKYNHFFNKNKVIFEYTGGSGIKIGYTIKSGRTLAASAERDGLRLICVVMGAPDWFNDSYKLMDYGFSNYEICDIYEGGRIMKAIPVRCGDKDHVFVGVSGTISLPFLKGSRAEVTITYNLPAYIDAPVNRWQEAGEIEIRLAGELVSTCPLFYLEDIDRTVSTAAACIH